MFVLKKEMSGCTTLAILHSGLTVPKFTKFANNVARSSQMDFLKSEWRYSKPIWNANATNENELADFANFDPKFGCHGNVH